MSTIETERLQAVQALPQAAPQAQAVYALGHSRVEYQRLRLQARAWEGATGRLLDQLGLGPGASCLDAGCGPGETMRAMAQRVGPTGRVLGIDADASLGAMALEMLHGAGHRNCSFQAQDLAAGAPLPGTPLSAEPLPGGPLPGGPLPGGPLPGGPFDLVYARLLLFHLPQRVGVLRRLWEAVAPGGYLLVQDYDLRSISTLPELDWVGELLRVFAGAFGAAGADVSAGTRLPQLFAEAGLGTPDGTDVAGRLEPLATGRVILEGSFRSVLPTAVANGVTTLAAAAATLAAIDRDATRFPDHPVLWPLMIGAWKRKKRA